MLHWPDHGRHCLTILDGCGLVLEETETALAGMGTDNMESWQTDICHRQREMRGKAPNIQIL